MKYSNKIISTDGDLSVTLDVYLFMEEDTFIAYSPALDLSGYGMSEEEARSSFSIVLQEYISHGVSNNTLVEDLQSHGWEVEPLHQHVISAPSFSTLWQNNIIFKDILENKEYRKVAAPFPVMA